MNEQANLNQKIDESNKKIINFEQQIIKTGSNDEESIDKDEEVNDDENNVDYLEKNANKDKLKSSKNIKNEEKNNEIKDPNVKGEDKKNSNKSLVKTDIKVEQEQDINKESSEKIKNNRNASRKNIENNVTNKDMESIKVNILNYYYQKKVKYLTFQIKNILDKNEQNQFNNYKNSNVGGDGSSNLIKLILDSIKIANLERKIEDINIKLIDLEIVEVLKNKLQNEGSGSGTSKNYPALDEYFTLFQNLEKKIFKKFEFSDERASKLAEQLIKARENITTLLSSVEVLTAQEKYILDKQQKYQNSMEKVQENTIEKFEKFEDYCEETYSK